MVDRKVMWILGIDEAGDSLGFISIQIAIRLLILDDII
jgi:hypothetical protein